LASNQAEAAAIEFFEVVSAPRKRLEIAVVDCGNNRIDLLDSSLMSIIMRGSVDICTAI
jgi:hypothetical protein